MTIVLKQGEINSFEADSRYVKRNHKDYVQYKGRTYRVLNFVRRLTPCECFMRGLAWALSCITIIPALFCWARFNRLLSEARTKTEVKVVYAPVDYQAKFEELKVRIEKIKVKPAFINALMDQGFSIENYSQLKKWLRARDTLVVWAKIAVTAKIAVDNLDILEFPHLKGTIEKAEMFADWCIQNKEKITELNQLNLNDNQLSNLPKEIGHLSKLNDLYLRGNQLSDLPKEIGNLTLLTFLGLKGNQFRELPKIIFDLIQLINVDLSYNQLSNLPKEIGSFSKLRGLNLCFNQLSYLPEEFDKLSQLELLYLVANKLSELPKEIGKLSRLEYLHLGGNQLSHLPNEIGNLRELIDLGLSSNQLSDLPKEIGNLCKLSRLNLSYNQLSDLPKEIGNLHKLADLNLSNNQLSDLPKIIGSIFRLKSLYLVGNPLIDPQAEIEKLKRRGCDVVR